MLSPKYRLGVRRYQTSISALIILVVTCRNQSNTFRTSQGELFVSAIGEDSDRSGVQ